MKNIIFLTAFLVLMISAMPSIAQTSTYEFEGITSSFNSSDEGVTFSTTDTCQVQMRGTNSFVSSGSFDSAASFRSPDSTTIGTSTLFGISNTSCLSYGSTSIKDVSTDGASGMYESSWSSSNSADSGFTTLGTKWICAVNSDITDVRITRDLDSRGFCQYRRRAEDTNLIAAWRTQLQGSYNICGEINDWMGVACSAPHTTSGGGIDATISYIYPFNSSVEGIVNYSFSTSTYAAGSTVFPDIFIDLIRPDDGTIQNLHTEDGGLTAGVTFSAFSDDLSLTPSTMYLWMVTYVILDNGIAFTSTITPPELNMTIFTFAGDFVCGDFGACINGTQSRACVDQEGFAPDRIETRGCFDVPFFENLLGFEQSFTDNVWLCGKDWFLASCVNRIDEIDVQFPINWTVSGDRDENGVIRQNYIDVVSDTSTEGSRSLKMWYIPPKPDEPVSDPGNATDTICGNKTIGDFPETTTGFNESLFLSTNITFPAPFIDLRFDVRKCNEPVLQYDYTGDLLGINCGERCYAFNCTQEPLGRYGIRLIDSNTGDIIVDFSGDATNDWRSVIMDLSDSGLEVGHNYTLSIAMNPTNQFDPFTHCAYFDDVRATLRTTAISECNTVCDGLDLLLSTQQGNSCIFTTIINSPSCAPDTDTATSFQNFDEVCIGTTLHFFNNDTGLWDQIEDNDICISEINETITDTSIVEPLESAEEWLDWILFLVSPLFIFFFISIAISGAVGALVKAWQAFGITFAFCLMIGTLITVPGGTAPVIPIWVGIAMIAVISLLIAKELRNTSVGTGGG